jgi:hypothetical protein
MVPDLSLKSIAIRTPLKRKAPQPQFPPRLTPRNAPPQTGRLPSAASRAFPAALKPRRYANGKTQILTYWAAATGLCFRLGR